MQIKNNSSIKLCLIIKSYKLTWGKYKSAVRWWSMPLSIFMLTIAGTAITVGICSALPILFIQLTYELKKYMNTGIGWIELKNKILLGYKIVLSFFTKCKRKEGSKKFLMKPPAIKQGQELWERGFFGDWLNWF